MLKIQLQWVFAKINAEAAHETAPMEIHVFENNMKSITFFNFNIYSKSILVATTIEAPKIEPPKTAFVFFLMKTLS